MLSAGLFIIGFIFVLRALSGLFTGEVNYGRPRIFSVWREETPIKFRLDVIFHFVAGGLLLLISGFDLQE
jgi:hypothetical protein